MAVRSSEEIAPTAEVESPVAPVAATPQAVPTTTVNRRSIIAAIASTFIVRLAGQGGFVILGTYLSNYVTDSVAAIAFTLSGFYLTELFFAPIIGTWSDRRGRKPFLIASPLAGAVAILFLALIAYLFANPRDNQVEFWVVLGAAFVGRLMQGASTALN